MKIIFMGSAAFAVPSLIALQNAGHKIGLVITQPDKPAGRGRRLTSPPVAITVKDLGLNLYQPKSIKTDKVIEKIRALKPDIIIIVAYGKLLPKEILEMPKFGCVNLHASLLPKYRGAAPINWAIINGDKKTGVTTMFINERLDAGDMLLKKYMEIDDSDTAVTLHDKLSPLGADLLLETIEGIKNNSIVPVAQNELEATSAPILKKQDGKIDWQKGAETIRNLVRGMLPWPSAYTHLDGKMLRIFRATAIKTATAGKPGSVSLSEDSIIVATGNGGLRINELQLEGKRRMTSGDFLHGHAINDGTILE